MFDGSAGASRRESSTCSGDGKAKEADRRAVDTAAHWPETLDDELVPVGARVLAGERYRLGLARSLTWGTHSDTGAR
jgi:hypothetical protein